jgi:acetyl-CoA carboxylase biotin carboxyl carrier protein
MKMEIPVEAPEDGRVAEIRVAEGQAIEEGDILVVLES